MSPGRSWTLVTWAPLIRRSSQRPLGDSQVLVLYALVALAVSLKGGEADNAAAVIDRPKEEVVCSSVDIRNSVSAFSRLENCTVIEGFLQVQLIDRAEPGEYANLSFPKLREITGYLLLFRVKNLKSLRTIFPNLAVIRGSEVFHNYALVIYEMFEMEEIGLRALTDIMRGGVRIEKNPRLCYVHSIDWDHIAPGARGAHFIRYNNEKSNECPNTCPDNCPTMAGKGPLCWSQEDCQKKCDKSCGQRACMSDKGDCCHESCVGGCWNTTLAGCHVCRQYSFEQRCTGACPTNTFLYFSRRCLNADECRSLKYLNRDIKTETSYKPFQKRCESECPSGYHTDPDDDSACLACEKECPKACPGVAITNIADAQKLKGCTIIEGNLEIKISGAQDVLSELQANLNMITEIRGQLKVIRSFPITSLDFLSSLRRIEGRKDSKQEADNYALYVLDNQNLDELWSWKTRESGLEIGSGKLFFHFNPKLCIDKIRELERRILRNTSDPRDVSPRSNGDRTACKVKKMMLFVTRTKHDAVDIEFTNFLYLERQINVSSLLGYLISYKEAPSGNVSMFEDADPCVSESETWRVKDESAAIHAGVSMISYSISNLKPFTRYAVYVKTYTVASEQFGGSSDIEYFTTESTVPTPPVNVKASSESPGVLRVSWEPPKQPNGYVSFYVVTGELEAYNEYFIYSADHCRVSQKLEPEATSGSVNTDVFSSVVSALGGTNSTNSSSVADKCCACPKDKAQVAHAQQEYQDRIDFENFLHNNVFQKRLNAIYGQSSVRRRRKREISKDANENHFGTTLSGFLSSDGVHKDPVGSTEPTTRKSASRFLHSFSNISLETSIRITGVKHFSTYIVKLRACHGGPGSAKVNLTDPFGNANCSPESIVTVKTAAAPGADNVNATTMNATVSAISKGSVFVKWDAPSDPNGLILKFDVETRRVDGDHDPTATCISYRKFMNASGIYLTILSPGNYSLRVSATTLWRTGDFSEAMYFYIPGPPLAITPDIIAGIAIAAILFVAGIMVGAVVYIKKREPRLPEGITTSVNPEYLPAEDVYNVDEWEVPREKITLLRELGQGSFGMVYEGEAKDIVEGKPVARCAVKTVNPTALLRDRMEFLNEASVMKGFNCHHVVQLLGVVSKGQPTYVVMELMFHGDLKTYLRLHRPDEFPGKSPPSTKRILQMAIEIADGMAYLADEKFVHRDLAARNCMVAEDLTVKIGDFGMTRDTDKSDYYRRGSKKSDLPVRWMAPESMKDGVFSSQSDVWSFGIVLWEMATLASQPYQGLSNDQVIKYVLDGETMEKPKNCLEILHEMMRDCWNYSPKLRPTFPDLVERLLPNASARFSEVSFYQQRRSRNTAVATTEPDVIPNVDVDDAEYTTPATPLFYQHRDGGDGYTTLAVGGYGGQEEEGSTASRRKPRSRPQRQFRVVRPSLMRSEDGGSEGASKADVTANGLVANGTRLAREVNF